MSKTTTISCQERTADKAHRNKMKKEARVPGIIYSKGEPSIPVSFNGKTLNALLSSHGAGGLLSLEVEGNPTAIPVVVRELQRNPINRNIIHVDFMRVNLALAIEMAVAVQISGEQKLHDKGGVLQTDARELHVSGLPQKIPEYLVANVSHMVPGDQITASDLVLPEGVKLVSAPDLLILSILNEGRISASAAAVSPEKPEESEQINS